MTLLDDWTCMTPPPLLLTRCSSKQKALPQVPPISIFAVVTQIINSLKCAPTEHVYLCTTPHLVMVLTNQSLFCVPCVPPTRMLCEWMCLMFTNMPAGGALHTLIHTLP